MRPAKSRAPIRIRRVRSMGWCAHSRGPSRRLKVQGSVDTYAYRINASGTITGYYRDVNNVTHGYVRTRKGTITTFDVPNGSFTAAFAINNFGAVTGHFTSTSRELLGFIRI